jgi:hypothetical protein
MIGGFSLTALLQGINRLVNVTRTGAGGLALPGTSLKNNSIDQRVLYFRNDQFLARRTGERPGA